MMEDNLKELVKLHKRKYEIISKANELQNVIDLIERRCNCIISVRNYNFDKEVIDAKIAIGRCDNDCIDEDDVCGDIIEALKAVKGKYIKAFKELDTDVEESKENVK
jgi:hypothetical protein